MNSNLARRIVTVTLLVFILAAWQMISAQDSSQMLTTSEIASMNARSQRSGSDPDGLARSEAGGPLGRAKVAGSVVDSGSLPFLLFPTVLYGFGNPNPTSLALGDVNGDGNLDLIVTTDCSAYSCNGKGSAGVLLGNGDGTLQPVVNYDTGGWGAADVAVADVNGDGKPDLLVVNRGSESNGGGKGSVGILLGNGDGTFRAAVAYETVGIRGVSIAVADVNKDGKPDLLVANQCFDINANCSSWGWCFSVLGKWRWNFSSPARFRFWRVSCNFGGDSGCK